MFKRIGKWFGRRADVVTKFVRRVGGEQITIIGPQRVGKTSLIEFMLERELPTAEPAPTVDANPVFQDFQLEFGRGKKKRLVKFRVTRDQPGNENGQFRNWEPAAKGADRLWYLFRVDKILACDQAEIELFDNHITLLKKWISKDPTPPKVLLIGTHADKVPQFAGNPRGLRKQALEHPAIELNRVRLGLDANEVIIGSLQTTPDAHHLRAQIGSAL